MPSVSTSRLLPRPGTPDQQRVAAGEQGDQRLIHHLLLAEDHAADRGTHPADARAERLDLREDRAGVDRRLVAWQPYLPTYGLNL